MITTSLPKIKELAERYTMLKNTLDRQDAQYEIDTQILRNQLDEMKDDLVKSLSKTGLPSVRTSDDSIVSYVKRSGVAITNEMFALKWAMQNQAVKIDQKIAGQIIKEMNEIPKGFEKIETEHITVKGKPKKKKDA